MKQWYAHGWKRQGAPALNERVAAEIYDAIALKAELLGIEARLRAIANTTKDSRLAARVELAADHTERAISLIDERVNTRGIGS